MHKIAKSCGNFVVESKKCSIFAPQKEKSSTQSGCSAVRLAHLLWEQGVPSSNLGTPTIREALQATVCKASPFFPQKADIPLSFRAPHTMKKCYSTNYPYLAYARQHLLEVYQLVRMNSRNLQKYDSQHPYARFL